MPDILAAIALPQLERLEEIVAARGAVAARYDAALAGLEGMEPAPRPTGDGDRHSYQAYIARAPDRATRDRLIAGLREHGVESPDRHLPRARASPPTRHAATTRRRRPWRATPPIAGWRCRCTSRCARTSRTA